MIVAFFISLYLTIGIFDLMARGLWIGIDDKGVIPGLVAFGVILAFGALWPFRAARNLWEAL